MWRSIIGFPLAHWRGQIHVFWTFALTLVGLRVVLGWAGGIPYLTLDVGLFVWQVVGAARALGHAQADRPDFLNLIAGWAVILACLPSVIWPQLDRYAAQNASAPILATPETGVRLIPTAIALSGPITFEMFAAFEVALAENPQIRQVVLNSEGGRVFAARGLARLIREAGLGTHVDVLCASACTLAFMAGDTRTMTATARLGFHGYRNLSPIKTLDDRAEERVDRDAFLAAGVAPDFVAAMFEPSPDDIWFPPHDTLREAGVLQAK